MGLAPPVVGPFVRASHAPAHVYPDVDPAHVYPDGDPAHVYPDGPAHVYPFSFSCLMFLFRYLKDLFYKENG